MKEGELQVVVHPIVERAFALVQTAEGANEAARLCIARLIDMPDDGEALFILAVCFRYREMTEQAIPLYRRAYRSMPWYTASVFNLGRCLRLLGRHAEAVEAFREAQAVWPDDSGLAFQMAESLTELKEYDAAAQQYDRCARLTQDVKALVNGGSCLRYAGRLDEARSRYQQAAQLQPGSDAAWYGLGIVARLQATTEEAIVCFSRSTRTCPDRARGWYHASAMYLRVGDYESALRASEAAVASEPAEFYSLSSLAEALERMGRMDEAYAVFGRARRVHSGYGLSETRRQLYRFRRLYGPPLQDPGKAPSSGVRGLVTMQMLGANGRFGNQILQYGFLRLYAARHGLRYQVPEWMGSYLFDLVDPPVQTCLPIYEEAWGGLEESLISPHPMIQVNRDLEGYFCRSTHFMAGQRELFRHLFTPSERFRPWLDGAVARLRSRGRTVVAIHLRRGDFGWGPFWVAPAAWYKAWLARLWPLLVDPVLYVASDSPGMVRAFDEYDPVTLDDIGQPIPDLAFFMDHLVLSRADVVGISNSTFSFTATMLNETGTLFFRPDKHRQEMVPYDPWNAEVLI